MPLKIVHSGSISASQLCFNGINTIIKAVTWGTMRFFHLRVLQYQWIAGYQKSISKGAHYVPELIRICLLLSMGT